MQYEPIEADNYYHIFNQGNNRENIFKAPPNYIYFLNLMDKYLTAVCNIYAYCLLKNHFHFILKTKPSIENKIISQKFSHLFNAYAQAINKSTGRTGSLFRTRFKRKKITTESYLRQLIIYTHLNPEKHGFVSDFKDYEHSSYPSYLSNLPSKLHRNYILNLFGGIENFKHAHQQKSGSIDEIDDFY